MVGFLFQPLKRKYAPQLMKGFQVLSVFSFIGEVYLCLQIFVNKQLDLVLALTIAWIF